MWIVTLNFVTTCERWVADWSLWSRFLRFIGRLTLVPKEAIGGSFYVAGPTVGKLKALQVIGSTPNWKQFAWLTKYETYFTNMCFLNELSHIGRDSFPSARVHKGWVSNYNSISAQVGACRPISWVADWYARTHSVCSASWVSPVG